MVRAYSCTNRQTNITIGTLGETSTPFFFLKINNSMKKTLTLVAAFIMAAAMANAETSEVNSEVNEKSVAYADLNTDAAILEAHQPLMAAPQADAEKDAKYWAQAVGSRIKVTGYAQGGYTATFNDGADNTNTFDLKRIILMVGANISKDFYAFFMHEFKSGNVMEYYMEYRPSKAINFRLGQSKIELSMENPMSPTVLESVTPMSQSVGYLCGGYKNNGSGRDNGIMMYGNLFDDKLKYVVEVLNGGVINKADDNNQKDIVAKLEYKLLPNLRVSASGMKGYSSTNSLGEKCERYKANRYAVGAEWKSSPAGTDYNRNRCAMVRAEVLGGEDGEVGSFGAYCSAAIPVYKQLDVVAMVDYFNKNTDFGAKQTNLMAGVQYWIHKKCRLQAQYLHAIKNDAMKVYSGSDSYGQFLSQVQVAF